jgi:GT2 family glycosyltransferase
MAGKVLRNPLRLIPEFRRLFFAAQRTATTESPEASELTLSPPILPQHCRLVVVGYAATPCHWTIHAWLHRCPLPPGFQLSTSPEADAVGLHLQSVELSRSTGALDPLRELAVVLDPSQERTAQLRDLGLNAYWLDPQGRSSGWLDDGYEPATASRLFGLPDPTLLRSHGEQLCLGTAGDAWECQLRPPIWGLPGFADLHVPDEAAARQLAGWLNACNRSGLQLIRLNGTDYEYESRPYAALDHPVEPRLERWVPPLMLDGPVDAESIDAEIAWIHGGQMTSPECPTPQPTHAVLWEGGSALGKQQEASTAYAAAVCISLYNYKDRIQSALESAYRQTHAALELIIVDDASTDAGQELVMQWLQTHGQRFTRACLLRHSSNAGLAAARNTAFASARSEWCFVLDADNLLKPEAVSHCLAVARGCPPETAVVHPLVELQTESRLPGQPERALLTRIPWQKQALMNGNQIDAMALIRRAHWDLVGGYSHLPDGWEDYDFWCKLIDAGLHGVICPQVLAIYNRHSSSMQATSTLRSLRSLNRLLAARHPWLQLNHRLQA